MAKKKKSLFETLQGSTPGVGGGQSAMSGKGGYDPFDPNRDPFSPILPGFQYSPYNPGQNYPNIFPPLPPQKPDPKKPRHDDPIYGPGQHLKPPVGGGQGAMSGGGPGDQSSPWQERWEAPGYWEPGQDPNLQWKKPWQNLPEDKRNPKQRPDWGEPGYKPRPKDDWTQPTPPIGPFYPTKDDPNKPWQRDWGGPRRPGKQPPGLTDPIWDNIPPEYRPPHNLWRVPQPHRQPLSPRDPAQFFREQPWLERPPEGPRLLQMLRWNQDFFNGL